MASGLLALVGVGVAIGVLLGLIAIVAVHATGLTSSSSVDVGDAGATLYLPKLSETQDESAPLITLQPSPSSSPSDTSSAEPSPTEKPSKATGINLTAGTTAVAPMEQIDLTGTYPDGEGAVLQVQRFMAGQWQDFNVTVVVSNQTFATYVQTSVTGLNRFRVVDTDTGAASNEVRVRVG